MFIQNKSIEFLKHFGTTDRVLDIFLSQQITQKCSLHLWLCDIRNKLLRKQLFKINKIQTKPKKVTKINKLPSILVWTFHSVS